MAQRLTPENARVFYVTDCSLNANQLIKNSDATGSIKKLKDINGWDMIKRQMSAWSNLGKLHLIVNESGWVCVVPSFYIQQEYRSKNQYFCFDQEADVYILKKPYRSHWSELIDQAYRVSLFPRWEVPPPK